MAQEVKHTPGPHSVEAVPHLGDPAFAIRAADGDLIAVGMIRADADLFAAAPELLEQCKLFERCIVYEIAVAEKKGDDEGARLKSLTLHLLREVIAKAEGR